MLLGPKAQRDDKRKLEQIKKKNTETREKNSDLR